MKLPKSGIYNRTVNDCNTNSCDICKKLRFKVDVYLYRNNVSAKHGLHVVCTGGELACLVELPGLVEGTERGVNSRNARRGRTQGCVHHHVLTQTCSLSKVAHSTPKRAHVLDTQIFHMCTKSVCIKCFVKFLIYLK